MSQTIDITELVELMRSSWVKTVSTSAFEAIAAMPYMGWIKAPIVSAFAKAILTWILTIASQNPVNGAFFLATAMRKAGQAQEYIDAKRAKEALSPETSDDVYEKAERAEMDAFNQFVRIST